jgi:hypothetical protein
VDITKVKVKWIKEGDQAVFTLCGPNAEDAVDFYTTKIKGVPTLNTKTAPKPPQSILRFLLKNKIKIRILPYTPNVT